MDRKTLGIDVDGVLADTVSGFLRETEARFGIKKVKEDITKYSAWDLFGMSKKDFDEMFRLVWENPEELGIEDRDIPAILDNLHGKFRIYITTAAAGSRERIEWWLNENRIPYDRLLHFTANAEKHKAPDVDIYIDDYYGVVENAIACGKTGIMLRQPWNDDFIRRNRDPRLIVAYGWRDLESILMDPERF
ncbi:MAG TPA: hypothetical protein VL945_02675 [Candidatus Saccharimonadales bacterium]|nr:hypothetical protein [Candidatus Saccharimonadales bacterium]